MTDGPTKPEDDDTTIRYESNEFDDRDDEGLEPGPSLSTEEIRTLAPVEADSHVPLGPETGMEGFRYVLS